MYPNYQSARCALFDYDKRSIANLYYRAPEAILAFLDNL
jgi:hypothetical protein